MQFYGMAYQSVIDLPDVIFQRLYQAITVLEAREMTRLLKVADWPNTKSDDRTKYFSEIKRDAQLGDRTKRLPSEAELAKKLKL